VSISCRQCIPMRGWRMIYPSVFFPPVRPLKFVLLVRK
jgi:hypothetical protein